MYSFQLVMKTNTDVATSPGATSGSRIRDEGAEPARAVDHRRLLELLRDAQDEAAQRPDRERQQDDVRCVKTSAESGGSSGGTWRGRRRAGSRARPAAASGSRSRATTKSLLPVKRYFASATAARKATHHRQRHDRADDDQAVLDGVPEVRTRPSRRGSAASVGCVENQVGVKRVDLVVRLERRRDHPEDGEDQRRRRRRGRRRSSRPPSRDGAGG